MREAKVVANQKKHKEILSTHICAVFAMLTAFGTTSMFDVEKGGRFRVFFTNELQVTGIL